MDESNPSSNLPRESSSATPPPFSNIIFPDVRPVHLIFASSCTLCLGAYAGYKIEMTKLQADGNYTPGSISTRGGLLRTVMTTPAEVHYPNKSQGISVNTIKSATKKAAAQESTHVSRVAIAALGVGSLLSLCGVTLLSASIIRLTGCHSVNEFLDLCKVWTPRKRQQWEKALGLRPKSMQHEDVIRTKGMTEEEEWRYIQKKYIPELNEKGTESEDQ